ncbi:MAG: hypothetical protein ACPGF7_09615 [Pontibacterium sp.]
MKNLISKLTTQEIKEQMFKMAQEKKSRSEQTVYGWLFDALEERLNDDDFDHFLDQVDALLLKVYAS